MLAADPATIRTASGAGAPSAMRSRSFGPSRGSVMFWLPAAPTWARAKAQRAATAGDEDDTAMPNMPVRGQRAAMENVMTASIGNHRYGIDLHQPFRPRQRRDDEAGRDRKDALEVPTDHPVDLLAIARVDDVDGNLANVLD